MNELTAYQNDLPAAIEDVAQFLLIAPEKATSMRAEIRAIKKLKLAQEVYQQKLEEQRRLCDLILDASVKLGEFTKEIPKSGGGRPTETHDSAVGSFIEKTKTEVIQDLGFTPKQVERFETLADNKDLVERVKAEARESGEMPTRTKVLDFVQERKKQQDAEYAHIHSDFDNMKIFSKAISHADLYVLNEEILDSVARADDELTETIKDLEQYIGQLIIIKNKLIVKGANYGKAKRS